jgi:hypothetical protein
LGENSLKSTNFIEFAWVLHKRWKNKERIEQGLF